ncbi:MAG: hypothetical protein IJ934_06890 [Acetobacter sp.]|nr:hypothetical protein [Acetobacter sp.]
MTDAFEKKPVIEAYRYLIKGICKKKNLWSIVPKVMERRRLKHLAFAVISLMSASVQSPLTEALSAL